MDIAAARRTGDSQFDDSAASHGALGERVRTALPRITRITARMDTDTATGLAADYTDNGADGHGYCLGVPPTRHPCSSIFYRVIRGMQFAASPPRSSPSPALRRR